MISSFRRYPIWLLGGDRQDRQSLSAMVEALRFPLSSADKLDKIRESLRQHSDGIIIIDEKMLATRHLKSVLELKANYPAFAFIAKCGSQGLDRLQHLLGDTLDGFLLSPFSEQQLEISILHTAQILQMRREHRKHINDLRHQQIFLEAVINGLPQATVVISQNFDIELVNSHFEVWAGVSAKELIGRNLQDFIEDGFKVLNHVYRELTSGKPLDAYRIKFKSLGQGEIDMHLHADFLTNNENDYIRGMIVTMNDQLLKETIIQQLLSRERLMVIQQLSHAMAHEIQNPTNILSGRLQLLQGGRQKPEDERALEIMQRQVERITEIIAKMQKFHGNRDDSIPEIFSMISFLQEMIPIAEKTCQREIHLRYQPQEQALLVQANRRLLMDAFVYLFGIVSEMVAPEHVLKIQCHLLRPKGGQLQLELKVDLDHCDIPDDLFEPFKAQLSAKKYSTLDAAIVHGILANYQARIYIDNGYKNKKFLKIEFLVSGVTE